MYRTENYPEHYSFIMKINKMCEEFDNPVINLHYVYIVIRNRQLANYIIHYLADLDLIEIEEELTNAIKKCIEEKKNDKRITNVKKYCLRKYGNMRITVKPKCDKWRIHWDRYMRNKYYRKMLFPEYIMQLEV